MIEAVYLIGAWTIAAMVAGGTLHLVKLIERGEKH